MRILFLILILLLLTGCTLTSFDSCVKKCQELNRNESDYGVQKMPGGAELKYFNPSNELQNKCFEECKNVR